MNSKIVPLYLLPLVALCASLVTDTPNTADGISITATVCPESCVCFGGDHAVCKSTYKEDVPISEKITTLELDSLTMGQIGDYLKSAYHVKHLVINGIDRTDESTPLAPTSLTSLDNLRSMIVKYDHSNQDDDTEAVNRLFTVYPQLKYIYLDADAIYCACSSVEFLSKLRNVLSNPLKIMQVVKCIASHPELLRHSYLELKQICAFSEKLDENDLLSSASESDLGDWTSDDVDDKTETIEFIIADLDHRQKRDITLDDIDDELNTRNQQIKSIIKKRDSGPKKPGTGRKKQKKTNGGKKKKTNGGKKKKTNGGKKKKMNKVKNKKGKGKASKSKGRANKKKNKEKEQTSDIVGGGESNPVEVPGQIENVDNIDSLDMQESGVLSDEGMDTDVTEVGNDYEETDTEEGNETPSPKAKNKQKKKNGGKKKKTNKVKNKKGKGKSKKSRGRANKRKNKEKEQTSDIVGGGESNPVEVPGQIENVDNIDSIDMQESGVLSDEQMDTDVTEVGDDYKETDTEEENETPSPKAKNKQKKKNGGKKKKTKKVKNKKRKGKSKKSRGRANKKKNKEKEQTSDIVGGGESNPVEVPGQIENVDNIDSIDMQESGVLSDEQMDTDVTEVGDDYKETDTEEENETPSPKAKNKQKKKNGGKKKKTKKVKNKKRKGKSKKSRGRANKKKNKEKEQTSDIVGGGESNPVEVPGQIENVDNIDSIDMQESGVLSDEQMDTDVTEVGDYEETDTEEENETPSPKAKNKQKKKNGGKKKKTNKVKNKKGKGKSKKSRGRANKKKNKKKTNGGKQKKNDDTIKEKAGDESTLIVPSQNVEKIDEDNTDIQESEVMPDNNVEEEADNVEEEADDVEEEADDVEEEADDVEEEADDVEEEADNVEEEADNVEEEADNVEEEADDVEEEADDVEEEADDVEEEADDSEETDMSIEGASMTADTQTEVAEENENEMPSPETKNKQKTKKRKQKGKKQRKKNKRKRKKGRKENKLNNKQKKMKGKKQKEKHMNEHISSLTPDLGGGSNMLEVTEQPDEANVNVGDSDIQESIPQEDNEIENYPTIESIQDTEIAASGYEETEESELTTGLEGDQMLDIDTSISTDFQEPVSENIQDIVSEGEPSVVEEQNDISEGSEADELVSESTVEEVDLSGETSSETQIIVEDEVPIADEDQVIISKEMFEEMKEILSSSKIDLPVDINDPYDLGLLLRHLRHHSDLLANIENPAVKQRVLDALNEQPEGANEE